MKIEDEIQVQNFPNEWVKGFINILFTEGYLEREIKQETEKYGITLQQFNVLRILRGQYPEYVSISTIRARSIDKMSDLSRLLDRMDTKGWVEKYPSSKDRRLVDIRISQTGLDLLKEMSEFDKKVTQIMSALDETEIEQLNFLLDKIRSRTDEPKS